MADDLGSNWWEVGGEEAEDIDENPADLPVELAPESTVKKRDDSTTHGAPPKTNEEKKRYKENKQRRGAPFTKKEFPKSEKQARKRKNASTKENNPGTNESTAKTEDNNKTKKAKRKRKGITQEVLAANGVTPNLFKSALSTYFNQLSTLEVDELALEALPKWRRICQNHSCKMSPTVIIVCSNALRACELNRNAQAFKGPDCKSIKLFSRHIKIDQQAEALKKNVFQFAVGTPERLKALLQQGSVFYKVVQD